MTPSAACLSLIKVSEGLRLRRYLDSGGHATIGWGHLLHEWEDEGLPNQIDEAVAESLLYQDSNEAAHLVDGLDLQLDQGQFDALVDFTFNFGIGKLRSSTLYRRLLAGDYHVADLLPAKEFTRPYGVVTVYLDYGEFSKWVWTTIHGVPYVEPGLVTRRAREGMLWKTGTWS